MRLCPWAASVPVRIQNDRKLRKLEPVKLWDPTRSTCFFSENIWNGIIIVNVLSGDTEDMMLMFATVPPRGSQTTEGEEACSRGNC